MYKMNIIILCIIILIIFLIYSRVENFDVFPYNSDGVDKNIYTKTQITPNALYPLINIDSNYKLYNQSIYFQLKDYIIKILTNYFEKLNDDTFLIQKDFNSIYYLDNEKVQFYIIEFVYFNKTKFESTPYFAKIQLNNSDKILDNFNLKESNESVIMNNLVVVSIQPRIDKNFNISALTELSPNYYKIENSLHLMDPFITSGKIMNISKDDIKSFNSTLEEKQSIALHSSTNPF